MKRPGWDGRPTREGGPFTGCWDHADRGPRCVAAWIGLSANPTEKWPAALAHAHTRTRTDTHGSPEANVEAVKWRKWSVCSHKRAMMKCGCSGGNNARPPFHGTKVNCVMATRCFGGGGKSAWSVITVGDNEMPMNNGGSLFFLLILSMAI